MTGAVLEALASHWRRNRLQLLTLVLGLALATALWSGVQAINAEARASYDAAAATLAEGRFHQLMPREGDSMPQALFVALRRAGWLVSPVVEGRLRVGGTAVRLVGVDPLTAPPSSAASEALARTDLNRFLRAETLVAGPEMAALLEANMPNPVLVDQAVAPGSVLADIGVVQKLLGRAGRISRLIVLPEQPLRQQPLADIAPDLVLQRADGATDVGRLTDSFHLNLTAFGFLSFAVGIFIVHGAIGLAFEQRRGVIRTLRALGVPLRRLVVLMIAELVVLATLAGALGIALGYLIAALLLPDVAATIRGLYGADVAGTLQIRPAWWLSGIAMALGGALLAAASALWRLARMPVVAGAGGRAWALGSGRTRTLQAAAAVVLLAAAGVLAVTGGGLAAGFALLACLLLGAALALPPCLAAILRLGEAQAVRAMAQWFWADTRQQLPGLGLALMALLLAMAANVGVSTMVSSFRLTFVGFLDQRLSAELYVDADAVADRAALERFLEAHADAVLPIMSVEATLAGLPAEIFGVRVGYTYRENWRFLDAIPAVWDEIEAGRAVVINEQLSRRAALHVGHTLALGPGLSLPVAGVVGDYGNPIGQAIVGEALFRQTFPAIEPSRYGVRTGNPQGLRRALTEAFDVPPARIIDQAAIKAFSLSVFERTFSVTDALNVLTLAVAAFAILMSLLTLAAMRLPQMAPVWAMGTTQRRLAGLEILRTVLLAAITAVLALPLGLALAWVLLAIVNVEAFGWRLPMYLFPVEYIRLMLFALAAALLAALWPAWRLSRMEPTGLLRIFANER
ncbi:FtsX-like permease family protein [Mesorhizobium escarrei]|uniref:AttF component of AttEFGH ABC transport system / AttG component of AttEFGH ABC transport system n=2 Tax=Mesorhizobium TaxID=68287 RepID=A0ABM9EFS5_9HYPH|nr:ABC transporter permease [Mesorhizobium escarrei]CAH2408220.1 AttF component of AttEFGH ABC transport system / AttG component of AttEFGH ABC transport system [Mesorhizobium escarrei]